MTWTYPLRLFTRLIQFIQHILPNNSPSVWLSIQWLSRYLRYPAVLPSITIKKETRNHVDCEWLIPQTMSSDGIILAIHGGANLFRWHSMHRHTYGRIAHQSQRRLIAPDFRVGPDNPYPAALEDCLAVYESLLLDGISSDNICIVGDSSGGNIAAALVLRLRNEGYPLPAALQLIAPVLDVTFTDDDPLQVHDPFANLPFIQAQFQYYCKTIDINDPMCSPIFGKLHNFPPVRIDVGEAEIFTNDAIQFAENGKEAQVDVELEIWSGLWHGWYLYAPYLPEAKAAHQTIATFIQKYI